MSQKICASCEKQNDSVIFDSKKVAKSVSLPEWLKEKNYVREFIHSMKEKTNLLKKTNNLLFKIHFTAPHQGRKILLWATKSPTTTEIQDAKSAYATFSNHQIGKVDRKGNLDVYLKYPQLYYVKERGKTRVYPRHFHFVFYDPTKKQWDNQVYTHIITPVVDKNFVKRAMKNKKYLFVDALPKNLFEETRLSPLTVSIPYDKNEHAVSSKIKSILMDKKDNSTSRYLANLVMKKKLLLKHVPLIVYCKNKDCHAAQTVIDYLLKKGFYNLFYYQEGFDGFSKRSK